MKQKCDFCGDWLEYTDTDDGKDYYVCIGCGAEYKFPLIKTVEAKSLIINNVDVSGCEFKQNFRHNLERRE